MATLIETKIGIDFSVRLDRRADGTFDCLFTGTTQTETGTVVRTFIDHSVWELLTPTQQETVRQLITHAEAIAKQLADIA